MQANIIQNDLIVSKMSESVAMLYRNQITKKQLNCLRHNCYTLQSDDAIYPDYKGLGCGWIEFDKKGRACALRYLDLWQVQTKEVQGAKKVVVPDSEQKKILHRSQTAQNIMMLEFTPGNLMPLILSNGHIRVLVNYSSRQLTRF